MGLDKQATIRRFQEIAVELGVPQELGEKAGQQCFDSMVRMAEKRARTDDSFRRKARLPVPHRPGADVEIVDFLNSLPAADRDAAIKNNVRPYVGLYEGQCVEVAAPASQVKPPEVVPHALRPIPVDMRSVAEQLLNDYSGNVHSVSAPMDAGAGAKVYRYRLAAEGRMQDTDKLVLTVDPQGGYSAVIDPSNGGGTKRSGQLSEFTQPPKERDIDETPWKSAYFDRFVDGMTGAGFTDDRGRDYGIFGLPQMLNEQAAVVAWCYPPANQMDLAGLSKIVVRGLHGLGTKEDSFYFDSTQSFEAALENSIAYAHSCLLDAQKSIEESERGLAGRDPTVREITLQLQKDAGWNHEWPFVPADLCNPDFRELVQGDPSLTSVEKSKVFAAGYRLGVVPRSELTEVAGSEADLQASESPGVVSSGLYSGQVLSVADGIVTQKIRRDGQTARHALVNLDRTPVVGEVADIKYANQIGCVTQKQKGQEIGHG